MCLELKKAETERMREAARQIDESKRAAEYEELMTMIHGPPPYDPRTPLYLMEGKYMPEQHLLEVLAQVLMKHRRSLPRTITTARDYLTYVVDQGWVQLSEGETSAWVAYVPTTHAHHLAGRRSAA